MASRNRSFRTFLENWPAKIIALGVAVVVVLFNDLAQVDERYFSVPLELRLSGSVVPGQEFPDRIRIRLRGNEEDIFAVLEEDVLAYVDFTQHINGGVFRAPVEIERTGSALDIEALEVIVDPLNVTVTLEEKLVASVEVVPNIVGFPPPGYELSDYRLSPTNVDVVGPRSRVEGISQVLTEEISLSGRTSDFSERIRLSRPSALVSFPGGDIIDFRALISETVVQTSFDTIPIDLTDLDPRFRVISAVPTATIQVQGKQLDLQGIPRGRIGVFVDASGINGPGTYTMATRPQIPAGVLVLEIEPARVDLVIIERSPLTEEGAE